MEPMELHDLLDASRYMDEIESARITSENRLRSLMQAGAGESTPTVRGLQKGVDALNDVEHQAILSMSRTFRLTPFSAWQKSHKGVGEKQAARLIGVIGDPYIATPMRRDENGVTVEAMAPRPRTISQLWAYCGYSVTNGAARRRRKGVQSNWKAEARTRAYLISTSCIKVMDGEYRSVYDQGRAKYSELSDGHAHNRSLRLVSKEILRDLWLVARDYHEK